MRGRNGEETLCGDGYVDYVDCFEDFMGVYVCQDLYVLNIYNYTLSMP